MASTNVHAASDFRVAIANETTFGTANTTQGQFYELHITDNAQVDWGGLIRESVKRSNGKRVKDNKDVFVQTAGGTYTVSVSGVLTDNTADLLLYGAIQDLVSEAATTPFEKIFELDASTTQPAFGAADPSEGKFYTMLLSNPASGENIQLKSMVISSLQITGSPDGGGRLSYTATFFTGFPPTYGATATASSWVAPSTDYYIFQQAATKTVGGNAMVVNSFTFGVENGATRVGFDSSGHPETYALGLGEGYAVTGEVSVKYDANSKDFVDAFIANPTAGAAEDTIIMEFGSSGADGHLKFDVNALYTGNSLDFGNEAGVFVSLPFEGVDDGTNEAIEVTISNAIDRGW